MRGLREDEERRGERDGSIRVVDAWRFWAKNGS